ncbi:hypothetical protein BBP40_002057 [Aspergillus hancockii]|nr:hypothetical protein BBP40_002057 [Aspergillus hancockii]
MNSPINSDLPVSSFPPSHVLHAARNGESPYRHGWLSGCGKELVKILYQKNAAVYLAGRSESKATEAMGSIKGQFPYSKGRLEFLPVDLSGLISIKKAVKVFESKEPRVDLWPTMRRPFHFSKPFVPILKRTASTSPPESVRVTWAASVAAVLTSPKDGAEFHAQGRPKTGNILLSTIFAQRYGKYGIVSVSWDLGNLQMELQRHAMRVEKLMMNWMLQPPVYISYTELYAGWSPDTTLERNGEHIILWGRLDQARLKADILKALRVMDNGGSGVAEMSRGWCQKETASFR